MIVMLQKVSILLVWELLVERLIANTARASAKETPRPVAVWRRPRYGNRSHFTNRYKLSGNWKVHILGRHRGKMGLSWWNRIFFRNSPNTTIRQRIQRTERGVKESYYCKQGAEIDRTPTPFSQDLVYSKTHVHVRPTKSHCQYLHPDSHLFGLLQTAKAVCHCWH